MCRLMAEGLFYTFVVLFLVRCGLIHSMWPLCCVSVYVGRGHLFVGCLPAHVNNNCGQ